MVQMGLEPYLIADSLLAVVTQRLVRKNCKYCKEEYKPHIKLLEHIKDYLPNEPIFYRGKGCHRCNMSGYSGRIMIVEILKINDRISQLISENKNKFEISKAAQEDGVFTPMVKDGLKKALSGLTSLEEIIRVTKG
jgi:general secretion pathway protein E/type IV pilus assembly protein PilB